MRDVAIARLGMALDQFIDRPPRDLPDGLIEKLKDLRSEVDEFAPEEASPGKQAARAAMPPGTPEPKKPDLSPGKKAANEGADRGTAQAMQRLAEAVSGRSGAEGSS